MQRFQSSPYFAEGPSFAGMRAEQLKALLEMVGKTQEEELSCDQIHRFLDQFAELSSGGKEANQVLPRVADHLAVCTECHEEYEALMRILQSRGGEVQHDG